MNVEQISIFLENQSGRLAEVTGFLSGAGVNIRALALADTADFGILRLIVDNSEAASEALKAKGFTVQRTDVVAVEVPDRPGGLHAILSLLHKGGVNVAYMYAFVRQSGDKAVMIFRFEDPGEAIRVLAENQVAVIDGETLYGL